jgi:hypothetical protein
VNISVRSSALAASAATLLLALPAPSPAATLTTAGKEEVVVTTAERGAAGLNTWPDGPMGLDRTRAGYTFYGANSGNIARAAGDLADPVASDVSPNIKIQGTKQLPDVRYASGGPIYDAGAGMMLMFIHLERRPPGSSHSWYGSIGLAKSTDNGHTWTFLGEIFKPNLSYAAFKATHPCGAVTETSFGQYVHHAVDGTDYFYIYSPDTQANCNSNFAVARAPVGAVVRAARAGTVSRWSKYAAGSWSEPSLGGRSTDVGSNLPRRSFDVAYSPDLNRYVLAITAYASPGVYALETSQSADGVNWSSPQIVFTAAAEIYAPTIVGTGPDPATATQQFYVYYSNSPNAAFGGYRWSDASLCRRLLSSL